MKENNKSIRVCDINQVGTILDFVHDRPIQLDKLLFQSDTGILLVPVTVISDEKLKERKVFFMKTWRCPVVEAVLRVKHALSVEVTDQAMIGEGLINTISMDGNHVLIKCSVPVEVKIKISSLELELGFSDTVVGEVKRFSVF